MKEKQLGYEIHWNHHEQGKDFKSPNLFTERYADYLIAYTNKHYRNATHTMLPIVTTKPLLDFSSGHFLHKGR